MTITVEQSKMKLVRDGVETTEICFADFCPFTVIPSPIGLPISFDSDIPACHLPFMIMRGEDRQYVCHLCSHSVAKSSAKL